MTVLAQANSIAQQFNERLASIDTSKAKDLHMPLRNVALAPGFKNISAYIDAMKDRQAEASQAEIAAFSSGKNVTVNHAKPNGLYAGEIIGETRHHLMQDAGRNTVIVHDKTAFSARDLVAARSRDQSMKIRYQDGQAKTNHQQQGHNQGHSR